MVTLSIPSWIVTFLSWLNFYIQIPPWNFAVFGVQVLTAGDWLNLHLDIGNWVLSALQGSIDIVSAATNFLWDLANAALRKAWDAFNLATELGAKILQNIYQTITNVYQTIQNVVYQTVQNVFQTIQNVYQTVSNVVQNIYQTTVGVTEDIVSSMISGALSALASSLNPILYFAKEIGEFFADAPGWIFDKIDNWLNEEV